MRDESGRTATAALLRTSEAFLWPEATLENSIQLAGLGLVAAVPVFWRFCGG